MRIYTEVFGKINATKTVNSRVDRFDWFFTFFDKSIFFISAGIILFIVGWFMEKGRKYMLSITKEEHDNKVESIN